MMCSKWIGLIGMALWGVGLIAPGKVPGAQWLETHRIAHGLGLKTHCTMLYNHVETYEERIEHLLALRDLQDETGGFMAFIPLPFHPQNTVFERRGWKFSTGQDDLKMLAVSRLMLDNIEHVIVIACIWLAPWIAAADEELAAGTPTLANVDAKSLVPGDVDVFSRIGDRVLLLVRHGQIVADRASIGIGETQQAQLPRGTDVWKCARCRKAGSCAANALH